MEKIRTNNIDTKVSNTSNIEPREITDINNDIRLLASRIAHGEDDLYKVLFKLGIWIENNIVYNMSSLTADAAQKSSWVLENKYGVCDELTSLFISMARSLGIPARFAGIVYTSDRYMFNGSLILSPILKAAVGEVGVKIKSHLSNALSKSSFILVLTFDALR